MSESQSDLTTYGEAKPENVCARYEICGYEICGNVVPGRGTLCDECLDELRARDREQREMEA